jgi:translation elongation factor EF-G
VRPTGTAEVEANLHARRGQVLSVETDEERKIIRALAPLAELVDYGIVLRLRTCGQGAHSMRFHAYVPYRGEGDGRDDSLVGALRRCHAPAFPRSCSRRSPKSSSISLPEPDDDAALQ